MTSSAATNSTALNAAAVKLAASKNMNIANFLKGLAIEESKGSQVAITLPKEVSVDPSQRAALAQLAELLGKVDWPETRRELNEAELGDLTEVLMAVKAVKGLVKNAEDSLRTTLFNHLDAQGESTGAYGPETPRDAKGFYLIKAERPGWKRVFRSGTPVADVNELLALEQEGVISHEQFLSVTRAERVIDEGKMLRFIAKNPSLLGKLRRAIKFTRSPSVSLSLD